MPSTNKTEFLGLSQWIGGDKPKRDDFNEDNRLLDEFAKTAGGRFVSLAHTLDKDGWEANTYRLEDEAITLTTVGTPKPAITITDAEYDALAAARPRTIEQGVGYIIIRAMGTVPAIDIPIILEVQP